MQINVYERVILSLTVLLLFVAIGAVGASVVFGQAHLPGPIQAVDPRLLRETPPFDRPGVTQTGPNDYQVVMTAQTWAFNPAQVTVPVGARVTFLIASADITHGILVEGTNLNLTIIPGQVSQASTVFRAPGSYLLLCHEYCGVGHQAMYGRVVVQ
jgi:cytochrome c oxidase subunit 2